MVVILATSNPEGTSGKSEFGGSLGVAAVPAMTEKLNSALRGKVALLSVTVKVIVAVWSSVGVHVNSPAVVRFAPIGKTPK